MAYGFAAYNNAVDTDGNPAPEVIISSEQQNLHFIGLASNLDSSDNVIQDGGQFEQQVSSGSSEKSNFFPNFTGSNIIVGATDELDGRVLITYTITTTGRPLAFIKPNVNAYDRWYAVISQIQSGDEWTFQVLMSGIAVDNFPELFCFVDANHIPEDVFDNDNYGMIVYRNEFTNEDICTRSDGFWGELDSRGDAVCYASSDTSDTTQYIVKTFDSRAQPLSVLASDAIGPRDYAPNDGTPVTQVLTSSYFVGQCGYDDLDHDFHSNGSQDVGDCGPGLPGTFIQGMTSANCTGPQGETNFVNSGSEPDFADISVTTTVNTNTKPYTDMMFACPSVGQAVFQRQAHGVDGSCVSTAAWWVMYRVAYRLQPHATNPDDNKVRFNAGWGTYAAGYNSIQADRPLGWIGSDDPALVGWANGVQPYTSGVIINDENVTVIVADSTKYELVVTP